MPNQDNLRAAQTEDSFVLEAGPKWSEHAGSLFVAIIGALFLGIGVSIFRTSGITLASTSPIDLFFAYASFVILKFLATWVMYVGVCGICAALDLLSRQRIEIAHGEARYRRTLFGRTIREGCVPLSRIRAVSERRRRGKHGTYLAEFVAVDDDGVEHRIWADPSIDLGGSVVEAIRRASGDELGSRLFSVARRGALPHVNTSRDTERRSVEWIAVLFGALFCLFGLMTLTAGVMGIIQGDWLGACFGTLIGAAHSFFGALLCLCFASSLTTPEVEFSRDGITVWRWLARWRITTSHVPCSDLEGIEIVDEPNRGERVASLRVQRRNKRSRELLQGDRGWLIAEAEWIARQYRLQVTIPALEV